MGATIDSNKTGEGISVQDDSVDATYLIMTLGVLTEVGSSAALCIRSSMYCRSTVNGLELRLSLNLAQGMGKKVRATRVVHDFAWYEQGEKGKRKNDSE